MNFSSMNDVEAAAFERDGYIVVRNMVSVERCSELRAIATDHLRQLIAPIEFEVDVPRGAYCKHLPEMKPSGSGRLIRK